MLEESAISIEKIIKLLFYEETINEYADKKIGKRITEICQAIS